MISIGTSLFRISEGVERPQKLRTAQRGQCELLSPQHASQQPILKVSTLVRKGACQELLYLQEQLATGRGAEPCAMTCVFFWV